MKGLSKGFKLAGKGRKGGGLSLKSDMKDVQGLKKAPKAAGKRV